MTTKLPEDIYKIDLSDKEYAIQKVKFVKETEKTYVIEEKSGARKIIKKSEMRTLDGVFVIGYDEAIEKRGEIVTNVIINNQQKIEMLSVENKRLKYVYRRIKHEKRQRRLEKWEAMLRAECDKTV